MKLQRLRNFHSKYKDVKKTFYAHLLNGFPILNEIVVCIKFLWCIGLRSRQADREICLHIGELSTVILVFQQNHGFDISLTTYRILHQWT